MPGSVKEVQIVVTAKDQASKVIGGIGSVLTTAIGTFAGNAVLGAATKGFDVLTGAIGDCFAESRAAAKGMAQTRSAIKSTGGAANVSAEHVSDLASALSKTTLASDDQVQAAENLLLTFTNVKNVAGDGNDIFDQTTKIALDMSTALGTDATQAMMQLGKSLNDPVKGMTALARSGVTFTEGQKEQIKTLQESGDVMGAQKIILAELSREFSGSAEAAAAADGGWHLFNQRLDDVRQTIGDALLPVMTTAMTWLAGPGLDMVEKFGTGLAGWLDTTAIPALGRFVTTVQGIAGHVTEAFQTGGITAAIDTLLFDIGKVVPGLEPVTTFLRDVAPGAISASETAWRLLRDSVVTFKEAWDGDWKSADNILPLHKAIGEFAIDARKGFDDLTTIYLPQLQAEFEASMPENQRLVSEFLTFLDTQFFPHHKDGMTAQEKATRDYGIQVGETTTAAEKSWADYLFNTDNSLTQINAKLTENGLAIHAYFVDVNNTIQEGQKEWDGLSSHAYTALNDMGNTVYTETRKIMGYINDVTQAVNDLWNRLWSLTHTSWKVPVPSVPGGGGGSGFGGGSGGGSGDGSDFGGGGPPPTGSGKGPHSTNNYYVQVKDGYALNSFMRKTGN